MKTAELTPTGTPPDVGVPPAESRCPGGEYDRVVCVPEVDADSLPIALSASSGSVSLPSTIEFTLANDSDATFKTNPYDWRLWKRVDEEWYPIAPEAVQEPLFTMRPGSTHEWALTLDDALPTDPGEMYYSWDASGTVGGLGGGEYAFTTNGWFDTPDGTRRIQFGVLLDVDAPPVTLEPTTAVTESTRDGDTVTVRGESGTPEDSEARLAEFVLERVADDPSVGRTLPEQAAQDYRLRNTLSYVEDGVERVRYVERNATWPPFGVRDPYAIRYEGSTYRVTASELESEDE
jgi:hypothetical protein